MSIVKLITIIIKIIKGNQFFSTSKKCVIKVKIEVKTKLHSRLIKINIIGYQPFLTTMRASISTA